MNSEFLRPLLAQVARYGIVGLLNTLLGYGLYLGMTWLGMDPKLAVTLLYPIGVCMAYFGHSKYSFSARVWSGSGVARYLAANVVGYLTNIALLYIFSDRLLFPHQAVQAVAVFVVAGELFLLYRWFVFPQRLTAK